MVIRKLGLGLQHLALLKNVGKTAIVAALAGLVTWVVYTNLREYLLGVGEHFAAETLHTTQLAALNFVGGSLVLLISGLVFAPIYLIAANLLGLIEDGEKQAVVKIIRRIIPRRGGDPVIEAP
jgi:hypothetical protein